MNRYYRSFFEFQNQKDNKAKSYVSLLFAVITFFVLSVFLETNAATITSAKDGLWSATTTWVGGVVPGSGDSVIINTNHDVTMDANYICAGIKVTGNLIWNNGIQFSVTGEFGGAGKLTFNSSSVYLSVGGNFSYSGDLIPQDYLNISFEGTGNQTISNVGKKPWHAITVNKPSGTLFITITPTVSSTQFLSGNINYNGGIQDVLFGTYPNDLTLSGSGAKTPTTNITVNGIFSFEGSATLSLGKSTTLTYGSNAALRYNTSASRNAGVEWQTPFSATGGIIIASQTITLNNNKVLGTNVPLTINNGAVLADGGHTLTANGHIYNSGMHSGNGKISLLADTIAGNGAFQNLEINKAEGVDILGNININGTLSLLNGNLNTGSNTITLGTAGILSGETVGKYIIGNLTTSRAVHKTASTFGGIGVALNAGTDDLGNVAVTRVSGSSGIITVGSNSSIARNWTITADNQPVHGRTLTLYWPGDDENGIDPTSVLVYRNDAGIWTQVGDVQNATTLAPPLYAVSVVTNQFSKWTIGGSTNPLPVELSSFSANVVNNAVNLKWTTSTEVKNYGFDIERASENIWKKIGFVQGSGNSNSPKEYSFIDNSVSSGKYLYRLKQIDNDGSYKYSKEIEITFNKPLTFQLHQNYPNPFNPSTTIKYDVPSSEKLTIKVYNFIGQEVATLFEGVREVGSYDVKFDGKNLASGIYFVSLKSNSFAKNIKMILMK